MRKIGLFFGSFNPIHTGHLIIANTIVNNSDLDSVSFVVSPQNPFKKKSTLAHEQDRLKMVELAIEGLEHHLFASDIEFRMPQPSYTIDTLTYIKERNPQHSYVLIMGQDNLTHFSKWKNHQEILKQYEIYVYPRPHAKPTAFDNHPSVMFFDVPLLDISATFIRQQVKAQKSIAFLVSKKVEEFIDSKGLYIS